MGHEGVTDPHGPKSFGERIASISLIRLIPVVMLLASVEVAPKSGLTEKQLKQKGPALRD